MALSHSTAIRNALADAVVDALDVGTTNPNGQLIFRTSGDVEVATLNLTNPAAGAAASGIATYSAIASDTTATGGVVAKATLENRDNTIVYTCGSVLTTGGDITLSSLTVGVGDTVAVSALTYEAPV